MSFVHTPPKQQKQSNKRLLNQTSPQTPDCKRISVSNDEGTVADMKAKDLMQILSNLATKDDVRKVNETVALLNHKNKELANKVEILTKRCDELEMKMEYMYIRENSSNLIIKMNRTTEVAEARRRVASTCTELSEQTNIIEEASIAEMQTLSKGKRIFKVYLGDTNIAHKILKNSNQLRGSDISISKDLPKQMREQQSKLLMVRRFLMKKSTAKPKIRDNLLVDGSMKFSWSAADGLKILSGESLDIALGKYNQNIAALNEFLSSKYKPMELSEGNARW